MKAAKAFAVMVYGAWVMLAGGAAGCVSDPDDEGPINGCESAPAPQLPTDFDCTGPDADGWSNTDGNAGPCPAPPQGGCEQVVLGRTFDTQHYVNCPGYIVLSRNDDWTLELNDNFIACTAAGMLGSCSPEVIVVSDRDAIGDFDPDEVALTENTSTVTAREICQLRNEGCEVTLADASGPGEATCDVPVGPPPETGIRVWRVTNYASDGGYITTGAHDADEDPPLLSSFPGGGIDPDIRAELAEVTEPFPTTTDAVDSVCARVSDFYRPPLASFILKASFDGQDVGIDGVFESQCD